MMEGFILAAGLGTRLRPLTDTRPKALVEIQEGQGGEKVTLLEVAIRRLEAAGVEHIVINVHHFADMVVDFVRQRHWQAAIDISDERALLMDTGGGLKKAAPLFSGRENVLVHNVDILSDIDLLDVEQWHRTQGNLVTLCTSRRSTRRMLAFDDDLRLTGRRENAAPSAHAMAFSGISVVSPGLFALLPESERPYPVIDEYIRLAASHPVRCYEHSTDRWLDVGKPETLEKAKQWILS
ncbi:MAG: nucleotidyltransferase family protein [Bacteroidales bacterium]|nr:nucleotidyltransferase family protein [Bacteroidales bacterium]